MRLNKCAHSQNSELAQGFAYAYNAIGNRKSAANLRVFFKRRQGRWSDEVSLGEDLAPPDHAPEAIFCV